MAYNDEDRRRLSVSRSDASALPDGWGDADDLEESHRPAFARDSDRLIDTAGFRRLQGKTQVISPNEADFARSRLTHTIEVSRIARSIAFKVCREADADHALQAALISEAAGYAHDFGHPPFGHGGERALDSALKKIASDWDVDYYTFGGFEGNAQTFRQLVWSFSRSINKPGLHLTRAVLDATMKYPWTKTKKGMPKEEKWGYFPTEVGAFQWVREGASYSRRHKKSFESEIMDWADDVTYATHDLEDWYRAGVIPLARLARGSDVRQKLAHDMARELQEDSPGAASENENILESIFATQNLFSDFAKITGVYEGSEEQKSAIRESRRRIFHYFFENSSCSNPLDGRHEAALKISNEARGINDTLRNMVQFYVLKSPRMATYEYGQSRVVDFLTKTYAELIQGNAGEVSRALPPADRGRIMKLLSLGDKADGKPEILRLIADYVSGMTDSYATMMYSRLSGSSPGVYNVYF
ncbi:deoxyguanosinetriphosphate triphosphohydrolase family protein [Streptomyces sp. NPDC058676]|uniref:deoxyguanosinetriphosphate triphosphohydrolase family protein n=1 Tax=unclassified Streptomyces TaxID=2593676 RepID=UPI003650D8D1